MEEDADSEAPIIVTKLPGSVLTRDGSI